MNPADVLNKYREMEIQTSSPQQLILLLYDEAIRCLKKAKIKVKGEEMEEVDQLLLKTEKIIGELMSSLNPEVGKVATGWFSLYEYMHWRLIQANLERKSELIQEVLLLLQPLREAWIKAMEEVNENHN